MALFSRVMCMINRHDPNRKNVEWNGNTYIGVCRHCGAVIERHGHRDWRSVVDQSADEPTAL